MGSHRHTECGLNDTDRTLKDSDTLTLRAVDVTCATCRGWLPLVAPELQRVESLQSIQRRLGVNAAEAMRIQSEGE